MLIAVQGTRSARVRVGVGSLGHSPSATSSSIALPYGQWKLVGRRLWMWFLVLSCVDIEVDDGLGSEPRR